MWKVRLAADLSDTNNTATTLYVHRNEAESVNPL